MMAPFDLKQFPFDDGSYIRIENHIDFSITLTHEQHRSIQIRTRASNRALLLRPAHEADQDHTAHRLLSGAANLSLRAMPQPRND